MHYFESSSSVVLRESVLCPNVATPEIVIWPPTRRQSAFMVFIRLSFLCLPQLLLGSRSVFCWADTSAKRGNSEFTRVFSRMHAAQPANMWRSTGRYDQRSAMWRRWLVFGVGIA